MQCDPLALELLGGPDPLPGAGDLDEDALAVDPGLRVQVDQPAGLGQRPFGVEAEPGIDLGGDPAGDDLEDLAGEVDEQLVHARVGAGGPVAGGLQGVLDGVVQQVLVLRLLDRLVEQRRVGGRVLGPVLGDGLDVAGVGDDRGVTLQGVEQGHGGYSSVVGCRRSAVASLGCGRRPRRELCRSRRA